MKKLLILLSLLFISFLITGCSDSKSSHKSSHNSSKVKGQIVLTSFKTTTGKSHYSSPKSTQPDFTNPPDYQAGYINSCEPDYMKVTIRGIYLFDGSDRTELWTGSLEVTLDGGIIDVSEINNNIKSIPVGSYNSVIVEFDPEAKIKGTLTGIFNVSGTEQELTVYTKNEFSYNSVSHTGGAASYSAFTSGPSEETSIWVGSDDETEEIETDCDIEIEKDDSPKINIVIDMNRMLRFYNGGNTIEHGGVNPDDPADYAYFFTHSVFSESIAVFIGDTGSIKGYQALYANYSGEIGIGTPQGVKGWMTVIYDSKGNFISGHIIGDDDNALTVAKGEITSYEIQNDGSYNFKYELDEGETVYTVTGLVLPETLNSSSPVAVYEGYNLGHAMSNKGEAMFVLKYQQ